MIMSLSYQLLQIKELKDYLAQNQTFQYYFIYTLYHSYHKLTRIQHP